MIYQRLSATATKLLKKYGYSVEFTRDILGMYDPSQGKHTTTSTTFAKSIVKDTFTVRERADSSIEEGDIKLIAERGDYQIGDKVTIDSDVYRVFMADPITPAQVNCAWILGVRK